ncbi:IseA DL-endopeptidase inhibitor family protein [Bacillus sp. FJAT-29790]|uniref:IseA DL-endopeptidase inhibitor family protein n=1 Tax=Bacillus sp. FJAT-29790 TaxID=1895002 RepID=UPI001C242654|nr:IseA DL-endopeptidase inhibitor family protein [Bacillus sp. FJAT-29790]MBU8878032.1 IseA DL-endopeptidase inhibitor family protein [Bacillus sp. FJAT-29790]
MKAKKWVIAGLAVTTLNVPLLFQNEYAQATEQPGKIVLNEKEHNKINEAQVVSLASKWKQSESYVQRGGNYKKGEYETFNYEGKTYRYLSGDIGTKKKLMKYLTGTLTKSQARQFIANREIIEYKGKMAQPEADGGSLLQWNLAKASFIKEEGKNSIYKLDVPVGETTETEAFKIEVRYVPGIGWRITEVPYRDINLDIPFNINPVFIFFNYLLIDHETSKEQFIFSDFDTEAFKRGIKKLEVRTMEEHARTKTQVEYISTFYVELENGYKGELKKGNNQMYFLIENTGEMEFKIVSAGAHPHIVK